MICSESDQSGILDFEIADVFQDAKILQSANEDAEKILKEDPELTSPENAGLRRYIDRKISEIMLETTL